MFANASGSTELHPMFAATETKSRMQDGCMPLSHDAALVRPVWEWLAARSHRAGLPIRALSATHDRDLRLAFPDGRSLVPTVISPDHYAFVLRAEAPRYTSIHVPVRQTRSARGSMIDDTSACA
jgi:hypothetical protein